MDQTSGNIYGIRGEGNDLCLNCAEKIYGDSLEMYMNSGDIQIFSDMDRPSYASRGLLCDECLNWIFSPDKTEDPWWLEEPDSEERLRLLAPFADFLETLQVDVTNMVRIAL